MNMESSVKSVVGIGGLPLHRTRSLKAQCRRSRVRPSVLPELPVSPLPRPLSIQSHLSPAKADQSLLRRLPAPRALRTRLSFAVVSLAAQRRSSAGNSDAVCLSSAASVRCRSVSSRLSSSLRRPLPNMAVKGTACKLRLQVPSAFGSGRPLPLR